MTYERVEDLPVEERWIEESILDVLQHGTHNKYNWRKILRTCVENPGRWFLIDDKGTEVTVTFINTSTYYLMRTQYAGWNFSGRATELRHYDEAATRTRRGKIWIMATERTPNETEALARRRH